MPDQKIQRVPRGLNELLSLSGGQTPADLEAKVQPSLDLLQFYGLTQRRIITAVNPAQPSGTAVSIPFPNLLGWNLLFACSYAANGNAAFTTLAIQLRVNGIKVAFYNVPNPAVAMENSISFVPPYPMMLEPGSLVEGFLTTAGAANAATAIQLLAAPIG